MSAYKDLPELHIPISGKAAKKLKEYNDLLNYSNDMGVRIGVKKEGAHLKKIIALDEKRFTDQEFKFDNLFFYIDRRELNQFEDYRIDFRENANQKGFIFKKKK